MTGFWALGFLCHDTVGAHRYAWASTQQARSRVHICGGRMEVCHDKENSATTELACLVSRHDFRCRDRVGLFGIAT